MSFDQKTYSFNNRSLMALCFAFKSWIACIFFILQAISPDVFTCISTGIIKDIAYEIDYNTKNIINTTTRTDNKSDMKPDTKSD